MTEPTLRTSHLFTLRLTVDPNFTEVGETPYGRRRIGIVTGGTFEGEELRGAKQNRVLMSYYSSHEGKAAIYLATLRLDALEEAARNAR